MKHFISPGKSLGVVVLMTFLSTWILLSNAIVQGAGEVTVDAKYPGLGLGILGSAKLEPMDGDTLLVADGFKISQAELMDAVKEQEPKLRRQLEKNLLFVLEQEATRRILLREAQKAGISASGRDENRVIQDLFERKSGEASISENELRTFYQANQEMVGGAPFEQVRNNIRQYLLQEKKQQAVASYIAHLKDSLVARVNESWVEKQNRLAADNPVDKARNSRKPTMVEFGATGCVPCDRMQPILDNVRKNYPDKLNVVFVHVREEQVLAARYGIRSIPVQVFFDARGKEVFRHVGFFPEAEVTKQLAQIGVAK